MKSKSKNALFSMFKNFLGCLFLFGIIVNLFNKMPVFPPEIIVACSALITLMEVVNFLKVQKKFGNDRRVDKKFFAIRAANWGILTLFWGLSYFSKGVFMEVLRCLILLGLVPIVYQMIKHFKPCRI